MSSPSASRSEIAVVGAGIPGLAMALGLAHQGLRVALVGPRSKPFAITSTQPFDPRVYAISSGSTALLQRLGVWARIDVTRTAAVDRMRVFGDGGEELSFDAYTATVERLATIIEESELLRVLDAACDYQPSIVRVPSPLATLDASSEGARIGLADGSVLEVPLAIGADGAQSAVRAAAGINTSTTLYGQTAVVAHFSCERPHLNVAWQWFCDEGVVALLPLPGSHVSLVWSAPDALAAELMAMDSDELSARVTERSGAALGTLCAIGAAQSFPLRLMTVDHLIGARVALVGDAAHVVHPLAGQGLNLGLQDVAQLLDTLDEREAFRDLGDPVLLRRYERRRAEDVAMMRITTDGLARLFGSTNP
ncbi:MAG: FAD-dependent monooxygenase, partial [Burkholderiaceae bacterium]